MEQFTIELYSRLWNDMRHGGLRRRIRNAQLVEEERARLPEAYALIRDEKNSMEDHMGGSRRYGVRFEYAKMKADLEKSRYFY